MRKELRRSVVRLCEGIAKKFSSVDSGFEFLQLYWSNSHHTIRVVTTSELQTITKNACRHTSCTWPQLLTGVSSTVPERVSQATSVGASVRLGAPHARLCWTIPALCSAWLVPSWNLWK